MAELSATKAYPPRGRLQIPVRDRRSAAAGASVLMACRPIVVAAHHAGWVALRTIGGRALPGPAEAVDPDGEWEALRVAVRDAVGAFDSVAVLRRRQERRPAILWLALRDGRPVAFVKAVPDELADGVRREQAALAAANASPPPVVVPRVVGAGSTAGWTWCATSPLPARPHRPAGARAPRRAIVEWLHDALVPACRDDARPTESLHWRPMHGDFAPWNLRRYLGGPLALVDFEEVAVAPPAADETYWRVARAALHGARAPVDGLDSEARVFWTARVRTRLAAGIDPTLDTRLLHALGGGDEQ